MVFWGSVLQDPTASPLLTFLLQLCLTLVLTRLLGRLFVYLKEPRVIGEIIGGILLGPSVFGRINGFNAFVFPPASLNTFTTVSNIGLIFFMFIMGMEVDPKLLKYSWKRSLPIALSAILFPFGLGALNSIWMEDVNNTWLTEQNLPQTQHTAFVLFAGTSMSFTAFPVLAALLTSMSLLHTPLGVQVLSCAAVDDVTAWCLLAISSSFAVSGSVVNGIYVCVLAVIYVAIMLLIIKPIIHFIHARLQARGKEDDELFIFGLVVILLMSAYCAEEIGIHAFLGSFVAGIVVPKTGNLIKDMVPRMEMIITNVLLPLYFANSGIRTNLGTLDSGVAWGYTIGLIALASVGKMLPALLMSKLCTGNSWRFCFGIAAFMNTRGLVELIALNVGLTLNLLSTRMFTILVVMAVVTTVMTSPMLHFLNLTEREINLVKNNKTYQEIAGTSSTGASPRFSKGQIVQLQQTPKDKTRVLSSDSVQEEAKASSPSEPQPTVTPAAENSLHVPSVTEVELVVAPVSEPATTNNISNNAVDNEPTGSLTPSTVASTSESAVSSAPAAFDNISVTHAVNTMFTQRTGSSSFAQITAVLETQQYLFDQDQEESAAATATATAPATATADSSASSSATVSF